MARKLFLIIAIFLVIGQLVGQASADEGAMLSELSDMQDGPDDLAYELHSQVKRGARREKLKQGWEKAKPVLKKIGKVPTLNPPHQQQPQQETQAKLICMCSLQLVCVRARVTMTLAELLSLCALCMIPVTGWDAPWFCHGHDCPEFTVVQTYEDFEERLYSASHWLTVELSSASIEEVKKALHSLYDYTRGENADNEDVELLWPSLIQVEEDGDAKRGSVSWPVPAGTHLPKPNDATIRETDMPASRVYVRAFSGLASEADGYENLAKLRASVEVAGKTFVPHRFVAAGYDPPLRLINRHNEIWIFAE
ncbi:hypothetical protein ACEWY4_020662 [Coilia grayii]|uniref:SOUL heme-binding protein n=1 Tax=Coilia grayii TaxID=363190 RepID=A0ABD1J743_9TELE